jgi:major membrane immunogen (membrane-anchored lipoprotein)
MKTLNPTGLGICAALLVASALLTGCGSRTDEQAKAMLTNPDIVNVGTYDGCEVKFIDRGYQTQSFYLAKCNNTTTVTHNWMQQNGKSTTFRRSTVITQEIEKLQAEKTAAETKEKALEKLSAEERAALGIK